MRILLEDFKQFSIPFTDRDLFVAEAEEVRMVLVIFIAIDMEHRESGSSHLFRSSWRWGETTVSYSFTPSSVQLILLRGI